MKGIKPVYIVLLIIGAIIGVIAGRYLPTFRGPGNKPAVDTLKKAPEDTINREEPPDAELIESLDTLKNATQKDTAISNILLSVNGQDIHLADYLEFQNMISGFKGATSITQKPQLMALFNSLTGGQRKVLDMIAMFRQQASQLCRTDYTFPIHSRGVVSPPQNKIAYSWGAKQYVVAATPYKGDSLSHCKYEIHGLDCSGFIYQLLLMVGDDKKMTPDEAYADNERKPEVLRKYLKPYFGDVEFSVTDLDSISVDKMQSGDILYFRNKKTNKVSHIAIVLEGEDGVINMYQSLGMPNSCVKNLDKVHGPIVKVLSKGIKDDKRKYACVRISAI